MPLPLHFPSFTALAQALEHDPNILQGHTTVVIGGVSYSIQTLAAHTEFQLAIRVLTNVQSAEQSDQASGHPTVTDLLAQWLESPVTPPATRSDAAQVSIIPDLLPDWIDIEEWLGEQMAAESAPARGPSPSPPPEPGPSSAPEQPQTTSSATQHRPFSDLSAEEQATRCQEASDRLMRGETTDRVCRDLNIPYNKVRQWRRELQAAGALHSPTLTETERQTIIGILTTQRPEHCGFQTADWCANTLQALISQRFKKMLSMALVRQLLQQAFPSPQPVRHSRYRHHTTHQLHVPSRESAVTLSWSESRAVDPVRRARVMRALMQGMPVLSAVSIYGVNSRTAYGWSQALRQQGRLLANEPAGLREIQEEIIVEIIQQHGPSHFRYRESEWTTATIQRLTRTVFSVALSVDHADRLLQRRTEMQVDAAPSTSAASSSSTRAPSPPTPDDT